MMFEHTITYSGNNLYLKRNTKTIKVATVFIPLIAHTFGNLNFPEFQSYSGHKDGNN